MATDTKTTAAPAAPAPPADADAGYAAKLGGKIRKFKTERDSARTELEAARKELADLKAKPVDKTAAELRAELREIKHRKVYDSLAAELKAKPEALDHLWKLSGYAPDADDPDPAKLKALLETQAKTPGLNLFFDGPAAPAAKPGEHQPVPKTEPGPGGSRGGLVRDSGKMQVRRKGPGSIRDQAWMQMNQKAFNEALQAGNVEYID